MNINHTKMELEINSCKNYEILEVRQGDKNSRIIDFTFTVNGDIVDLTSTMSATVNATVDNVIVADNVAAVVDTENNVVTVTLTDTMLALAGVCKMDIVLTEGDEIITAETVCLRIGKSVINGDSKAFPGTSSISEITREVTTARGNYDNLNARLNGIDTTVANKADKSTVSQLSARMQSAETAIAGKANATDVTNALKAKANTADIDASLALKADKATTLDGYGITDAYTKEKADRLLKNKLDSMPFDDMPKLNSPCYLTSGTVYNALTAKYDASNIESGTSALTPYSTVTDKIKSASCTYKTIGDVVIVNATIKMNAISMSGTSAYPLIDLPYKCMSSDNVFCVGISSNGKLFKFAVPKNNTWLQFMSQDKTAYTFTDGEQINVTCLYKIK